MASASANANANEVAAAAAASTGPERTGTGPERTGTATNKLVFCPNGRFGNAIFRYLACAIVNIINPALEYTLLADFHPPDKKFTYFPGLDYEGNDAYQVKNKDNTSMEKEALQNKAIVGYNTLGFFKHTIIDMDNLISNKYINKDNGQGIYVKNTLTLNDDTFFGLFYKKLEYFNVLMDDFFQFGYIYLKYKPQLLTYMETHKKKHVIQTDINERFFISDVIDELLLPSDKHYDIAVHIRLGDFNGRPDFIEVEHYLRLFESMLDVFEGQKICLVYQPMGKTIDNDYIMTCLRWFQDHNIPIRIESNALLMDFNIMKQAAILVCSMSTLSWTAAYFSKQIQCCYMPNYNFYSTERQSFFFHKPIPNTILYQVKTTLTPAIKIKPYILTLPAYASRLATLDGLNHQLSMLGLDATIYQGVHGKDIHISDAASKVTQIKHITWKGTTYFYDMRVRLNGTHMTRGEFGCAWSHLNLLRQLVKEPDNTFYLILEDDVELVKPLEELYQLLQHLPADMDMCHLAKSDWYPFALTNQVNAYFAECAKLFFNKTTAYIVSKKGAQKILAYTPSSINVPIDDLYNMIYRLTDFRFYVPLTYFFKEQDNISSSIKDIDHA
jgi:GR25 family glycosyltransferase involved in LPS biosynthesis